jgi:hypothetical protein
VKKLNFLLIVASLAISSYAQDSTLSAGKEKAKRRKPKGKRSMP